MKGYMFLEKVTRADVAFEAVGKTPSELFGHAALALFEIQVDIMTVKKEVKRRVVIEADSLEDLLFDFLDELIFLKDKDAVVFCACEVRVAESSRWSLRAEVWGDSIDHEQQKLRVDAKAVTMHQFSVRKEGGLYKAVVVIDI